MVRREVDDVMGARFSKYPNERKSGIARMHMGIRNIHIDTNHHENLNCRNGAFGVQHCFFPLVISR
jgi:hypothetical protein